MLGSLADALAAHPLLSTIRIGDFVHTERPSFSRFVAKHMAPRSRLETVLLPSHTLSFCLWDPCGTPSLQAVLYAVEIGVISVVGERFLHHHMHSGALRADA